MTATLIPTLPPDIVDDLTRRELITGALAAGLLAACGRDGGEPGVFYIAQKNMQTNYTLHEDLGMPHAAVVPETVEQRRTDISYEEMGLLADVDVILPRVNPRQGSTAPDREQTAAITGSPLWATLPAVRAGAAFEIDGDLFYVSPLTAGANLDWAEQNLLGDA